jgi:hypothetical protein
MHLPADQLTPGTSAIHPTLRAALRSPRQRRPTGAAPPLPYRLQTSGVGWLVAAVVLVGLTLAVFAHGLRGPAVPVTVLDDAVVRWLAGLQVPGLHAFPRDLVRGSSWWVLFMLSFGLPLALIVLRRWRHLIVWLVAWNLGSALPGCGDQRVLPAGVQRRPALAAAAAGPRRLRRHQGLRQRLHPAAAWRAGRHGCAGAGPHWPACDGVRCCVFAGSMTPRRWMGCALPRATFQAGLGE